MASVAMVIGGAVVNALAFSGSNYMFSKLGSDHERRRHDKALEELAKASQAYEKRRLALLDYANNKLTQQGMARRSFAESEKAMQLYSNAALGPPPKLGDFYDPPDTQKNAELVFIAAGMVAVYFIAKIFKTT